MMGVIALHFCVNIADLDRHPNSFSRQGGRSQVDYPIYQKGT
ncbi:hypothetical protein RISK_001318 [Rhodopirellula islandica]|uniref:Uncharacterized protein n=1 Tax=Rhodopirellula islandica TaxID=595434 RepID=A0A0J1BJG6_RHOIS|nr:hypothetical protein RISK_001318 [Rhodopirellula islandica]